ncbi:hypothetical protein [Actinoplanes solisilvae]|uniref:hypothetical protein n=1 Tax=Actinoplanes solisilvae TaxID=2486853 RepID=UPI000FDB76F1|nr:hypothetical protein [Actinoplanes solisilvae]
MYLPLYDLCGPADLDPLLDDLVALHSTGRLPKAAVVSRHNGKQWVSVDDSDGDTPPARPPGERSASDSGGHVGVV